MAKAAKRRNNRTESGIKGKINYCVKIFDKYSNPIVIVLNIRNKIRNLNNLRKLPKYGRSNDNIINVNVFIKSVTDII